MLVCHLQVIIFQGLGLSGVIMIAIHHQIFVRQSIMSEIVSSTIHLQLPQITFVVLVFIVQLHFRQIVHHLAP